MDTNFSEEYKKQLIKYLFQCIISEGSKILLFSIIFLRFGLLIEFLCSLILLTFLRTNGGGLHFKHYTSCLVVSFLVFLTSIVLGIKVSFSNPLAAILVLGCIGLGYWCVPVVSANRPPASEKLIKKSKKNTILILLCFLILVCIVPINRYINIGVWIIVIHICQLLLAKLLRRRKK